MIGFLVVARCRIDGIADFIAQDVSEESSQRALDELRNHLIAVRLHKGAIEFDDALAVFIDRIICIGEVFIGIRFELVGDNVSEIQFFGAHSLFEFFQSLRYRFGRFARHFDDLRVGFCFFDFSFFGFIVGLYCRRFVATIFSRFFAFGICRTRIAYGFGGFFNRRQEWFELRFEVDKCSLEVSHGIVEGFFGVGNFEIGFSNGIEWDDFAELRFGGWFGFFAICRLLFDIASRRFVCFVFGVWVFGCTVFVIVIKHICTSSCAVKNTA